MDLNKFFRDVSRIADALDALADLKANGKVALPAVERKPFDPSKFNCPPFGDVDPGMGLDEINPEVEAHTEETAERKIESDMDRVSPAVQKSEADDRLRREFLKSELRKMNVPHAAAARTKTLEALYAEAQKNPPAELPIVPKIIETPLGDVHIPPSAAKADLPSDPDPEPAATIEQARAALVAYTAKVGKEKAVALLVQIGGAPQLSKCDPVKYAAIVKTCREALR